MPESESTPKRRTLLRTATLALATGIAGCTSITGGGGGSSESTNTPSSSTTISPPTPTPGPTATPALTESEGSTSTPTATQSPTPTETATKQPELSFPYMNPMTGTTGYGIELDGNPVMGYKDAPIDMYYWSDYMCPWCKTFALEIHPKIAKNEVANGTLRVVFLELPYKTKHSWPAAVLAKCVWRQVSKTDPNLYWKWHHDVFAAIKEHGTEWADIERLFQVTKNVGIDTKSLANCIEARQSQIKKNIEAEKATANKTGIQGTPAFLLYNRETGAKTKVKGAQPYARFSSKIQSLQ